MPRPKTHKISLQTKGLTHEQAAQLFYIVTSAASGFVNGDSERYDSGSNIPVTTLRAEFPDEVWSSVSAAERVALVK